MGIENLNRVHWIILGALLGVALAYAWASVDAHREGSGDQLGFERDVVQRDKPNGTPLIKGIVIHPPEADFQGKSKALVTYQRLFQNKQDANQRVWVERHFYAPVPYVPAARNILTGEPNLTIAKYLDALAKQNPDWNFVKYSNGWWKSPKNAMGIGALGGVVIIGGLWPTLLNVMMGSGIGPKPKPKKVSLWNVRSTKTAGAPKPKPAVTAAQHKHLESVTSAYEQSLQPTGEHAESTATSHSAATAVAVRKLDAAPLEEASKQAGDDDVEVKDKEYYPVLVHHQKDQPNKKGEDQK